ncbi:GNAT family protein [Arthrobacter sp. B10-11]|uniref:GNAT family N-acetyltransferase n=1 Tax=Arthrobacter sp. B10-11 TaxID=3081160 RepID=UPI002954312A|nr:GNAT family protein [Arthrobacter sp. B10-11]MDV8148057.1 GNAT family protein [Arthrobacter sp. B10-11]
MTLRLPRALPTLHTATGRFVLSPFSPDDVEPLAHLLANDDIWATGFGDGHHRPGTHEELVRFVDRRHEGLRIFAVHYTGLPGGPLFVGTTGITESHTPTQRVKIGRTLISPPFWGMKANHEVKLALLDWVFARGAGRVECDVDPRNRRSLSSLKRFGFTVEGTRRRSSRRNDGSWRDIVVLSLLTEEWPATRERALRALADVRNFPMCL